MKMKLLITSLVVSVVSFSGLKAQTCDAAGTVTTTSTPGLVNINDMSTTSSGSIWTSSHIGFSNGGFVNLQPMSTSGTYQFTVDGTYSYYLEVMDSLTNCYDSIQGSITITGTTAQSCDANFMFSSDSLNALSGVFIPVVNNGPSLTYSWDFGNGNSWSGPSSGSFPYSFSAPGTYNVCLIVSSAFCIDTVCQSVTVGTAVSSCDANFSYYIDSSINNSIYFDAPYTNSTTANYLWSFGDGTTSSSQDLLHTYSASGTYTVCLVVVDGLCTDSVCQSVTVSSSSASCDANFSFYEDTTSASNSYYFNAPYTNSSTANYYWDFGDGNTSNSQYVTHTYGALGTYMVCLVVVDGMCTDSVCQSVTVSSSSAICDANFSFYEDTTSASNSYYFNAPYTNSSTANYYWDFGDGNYSYSQYAAHSFSTSGTYTVCLSVWDGFCADTICQTVVVSPSVMNCNASYTLLQDSMNVGLYYAWNNSTGTNLTYSWDFGDGNTSTQAYPTHVYAGIGTYVICLTVTGPSCTSTYCDTLVSTVKSNGATFNVLQPGQAVGIETTEFVSNLNTYPNPFGTFVNVAISSARFQELEMSVINIDGSLIYSQTISVESGDNVIELDDLQLSSGIYLLNVMNPLTGQNKMHKMIKK